MKPDFRVTSLCLKMADGNKWRPQGEGDEEEEELDETVSEMSGMPYCLSKYLTMYRLIRPQKMLFYSLLKSASPCSLHHLQ